MERVIPFRSGQGLTNEQRPQEADRRLGRPGMEQWKILVLGVLLLEGIQGTVIRVLTTGSDAREALQAGTVLIEEGFGEL